jgi:hypothetical protein
MGKYETSSTCQFPYVDCYKIFRDKQGLQYKNSACDHDMTVDLLMVLEGT